MKKYIVLMAAALALTGCDQAEKQAETKDEKKVDNSTSQTVDKSSEQPPTSAETKDEKKVDNSTDQTVDKSATNTPVLTE